MEQLSFFDSGRDEEQAEIRWLIDQGFVFVANHSDGKDSQAMYARPRSACPSPSAHSRPCDPTRSRLAGDSRAHRSHYLASRLLRRSDQKSNSDGNSRMP